MKALTLFKKPMGAGRFAPVGATARLTFLVRFDSILRRAVRGFAPPRMRLRARRDASEKTGDARGDQRGGEAPRGGRISLVGAGPGARDLLTLRAIARLEEADVIFYDRLVDPEVLDLARPDAQRVFVGKHVGAHAWPQERINQMIVARASKGQRVVRLKSGDPGIFGRATEEIEAARAAGLPVELVPGVTAVSAAGAMMCQSLTQRNISDTLILTTGTGCASDPVPDSTRHSGPGTTTAFYMGVRHADRLASDLMTKGLPQDAPVDVACEVSKPGQRHLKTTLGKLAETLRRANVEGCAVLLVVWPKTSAAHAGSPPLEAHGETTPEAARATMSLGGCYSSVTSQEVHHLTA